MEQYASVGKVSCHIHYKIRSSEFCRVKKNNEGVYGHSELFLINFSNNNECSQGILGVFSTYRPLRIRKVKPLQHGQNSPFQWNATVNAPHIRTGTYTYILCI